MIFTEGFESKPGTFFSSIAWDPDQFPMRRSRD
jgi:hypothetical protein